MVTPSCSLATVGIRLPTSAPGDCRQAVTLSLPHKTSVLHSFVPPSADIKVPLPVRPATAPSGGYPPFTSSLRRSSKTLSGGRAPFQPTDDTPRTTVRSVVHIPHYSTFNRDVRTPVQPLRLSTIQPSATRSYRDPVNLECKGRRQGAGAKKKRQQKRQQERPHRHLRAAARTTEE